MYYNNWSHMKDRDKIDKYIKYFMVEYKIEHCLIIIKMIKKINVDISKGTHL